MGLILQGTLRMPMPEDPADLGVVEWVQFQSAAIQAADELTRLQNLLIANGISPDSEYICSCGIRRRGPKDRHTPPF